MDSELFYMRRIISHTMHHTLHLPNYAQFAESSGFLPACLSPFVLRARPVAIRSRPALVPSSLGSLFSVFRWWSLRVRRNNNARLHPRVGAAAGAGRCHHCRSHMVAHFRARKLRPRPLLPLSEHDHGLRHHPLRWRATGMLQPVHRQVHRGLYASRRGRRGPGLGGGRPMLHKGWRSFHGG